MANGDDDGLTGRTEFVGVGTEEVVGWVESEGERLLLGRMLCVGAMVGKEEGESDESSVGKKDGAVEGISVGS